MKKIISLILAMVMVLSLSVTAFAAELDNDKKQEEINVSAKYVDGISGGTVYSVDLNWGAMEFTYTVSGARVWNPDTHTYDTTTSDTWTASGNQITVTNHSNAAIKATFAFHALDAYKDVTGTFTSAELSLPSAEGKATDAAELTGKTALNLDGILDSATTTMTKIGAITVVIE